MGGEQGVRGLAQLGFGRDDAESDVREDKGGLLGAGFVRTAAFEAVLAGRKHVVIGGQGSGKSAICRELAAHGAGDVAVVLVTPGEVPQEELDRTEAQGAAAGVSAELLWRYVLGVEVARHVVAHAADRHGGQVPRSVEALRRFLADNEEEASLRVHRPLSVYLRRLRSVSLGAFGATVGVGVSEPAEAARPSDRVGVMEQGILAALEDLACPAGHRGLLVLADGLEQLWSADAWSGALVAGLIVAAQYVTLTFRGVDCVVFIRTDIYESMQFPQKNRFRGEELRISWTTGGLRELIEKRAQASADMNPGTLWGNFFPAIIGSQPTPDYLISRTLGRPRDIIQLLTLCQETAAGRGHSAVTQADIHGAEVGFSAWKLQDLKEEHYVSRPFLAEILELFQDGTYIIPGHRLKHTISSQLPALHERFPGQVHNLTVPRIIYALYDIGFLGVRREHHVIYAHSGIGNPSPGERTFYIHPCFRAALRAVRATSVHESETWNISLWGATACGKTTYLAALNIAASQSQARSAIYGINEESGDFLARNTHTLASQHCFPPATSAEQPLSFAINMPALRAPGDPAIAPAMPTQFNINLRDAPGRIFGPLNEYPHSRLDLGEESSRLDLGGEEEFADYLSLCDGLIFLLDPLRLRDLPGHDYFGDTLLRIAQRCFAQERTLDNLLPHYLAVCVSKFDDPEVYQQARASCHVRSDDPLRFPRLTDNQAREFFVRLCRENNAGAIPDDIARYFHPERTRYFATSSIGFYLPSETAQFNEQDFKNLVLLEDGRAAVRGGIYPINVIEPILWLGQCLTTIEEE